MCDSLQIVIVGDGTVGKTTLVKKYCNDQFMREYTQTVFETYPANEFVDENKMVSLVIYDTAGQEGSEHVRRQAYHNAHCFILCFAVNNPTSVSNLESQWLPELQSVN
eukprot:Sspe_Gene.114671::Locus_100848_Transcript_1_1_Confidence_1.000_Length_366::g.114671::m.114671/K04392/RAC1; Ras-related C3 botulinum toxin substrate 1